MPALTRADLLSTAKRFLEAYNKWTIPAILSVRTPTCTHRTGPKSHDWTSRTNEEFAAFVAPLLPVFRNFKLQVIDEDSTLVDVEKRAVSMRLRSTADTDVGMYENEYIFVLRVCEAGDLVEEVVEFLDTQYSAEFVGRLTAAKSESERL
jgi:ketosteroid isomerase-like protein